MLLLHSPESSHCHCCLLCCYDCCCWCCHDLGLPTGRLRCPHNDRATQPSDRPATWDCVVDRGSQPTETRYICDELKLGRTLLGDGLFKIVNVFQAYNEYSFSKAFPRRWPYVALFLSRNQPMLPHSPQHVLFPFRTISTAYKFTTYSTFIKNHWSWKNGRHGWWYDSLPERNTRMMMVQIEFHECVADSI